DHVRERSTAREERARPLDLEREQPLERGTDAARRERLAAPGKAIEVLVRNVRAAAGMVAGDVLPEVRQLERRADVVAPRLALRVPVAEEREDEAPDRVRRAPAVAEDVVEGREAGRLAGRVATEGLEQVAERVDGQVAPPDRLAERAEDGIARSARIRGAALEPRGVDGEPLGPSRRRPLVGQVVAAAREGVERGEVVAEAPRQEPRPDGEVLVVAACDAP